MNNLSITLKDLEYPTTLANLVPIKKNQEGAFIYNLLAEPSSSLKIAINSIYNLVQKTDVLSCDIPVLLYLNRSLAEKIPSQLGFPEENLIIAEEHQKYLPKQLTSWYYLTNLTNFSWICELRPIWFLLKDRFRLSFRLRNTFNNGHCLLGLPYENKYCLASYPTWEKELKQVTDQPYQFISELIDLPLDIVEDIFLSEIYGCLPRGIDEIFVGRPNYFGLEFLEWVASLPEPIKDDQLILCLWILKQKFPVSIFKDLICKIVYCSTDNQLSKLFADKKKLESIDLTKLNKRGAEIRSKSVTEYFLGLTNQKQLSLSITGLFAKYAGIKFSDNVKDDQMQLF